MSDGGKAETDGESDRTPVRVSPLRPDVAQPRNASGNRQTPAGSQSAALTEGSVIKSRFVLEECIGRGGMGTVYKARDLRKQEMRDLNPHVAIKVLNDELRHSTAAFEAMQLEARKLQRLSHPNIVTVHDFDRDGSHVYVVMEWLDGQPLDRLIARTGNVGIGVEEGIRVMRGVCQAIDHSHRMGMLRANFEAANAILTRSGVAKIFDFGFAQAIEAEDHSEARARARPEPSAFEALTPAYASCEVLEGQQPDPRDDVFAVACVTYELITGQHPYNRVSAAEAETAGMKPVAPAGMSIFGWIALRRGLSLRRSGRPATASALVDGFEPLKGSRIHNAPAVLAMAAALALLSVPVSREIYSWRERRMAAELSSGDIRRIEAAIHELQALQPAQQASVLLREGARTGIIQYYSNRLEALVDPSHGRFDVPRAEATIRELEALVPDSQTVHDIRDRLVSRKNDRLVRLNEPIPADGDDGNAAHFETRDSTTPADSHRQERTELEARLSGRSLSLAQAQELGQLIERLGPDDPDAPRLYRKLQQRLVSRAKSISSLRGLDAAVPFAKGSLALFPRSKELTQLLRQLLTAAADRDSALQKETIQEARNTVEAIFATPALDEAWGESLRRVLGQLARYSPGTDSYVDEARRRTAAAYLAKASQMRVSGQLDEAAGLLEHARQYGSASADITVAGALLTDARLRKAMGDDRSQLVAYIRHLKQRFSSEADGGDVISARTTLRVLQANANAEDHFLTRDAPEKIAQAYARAAGKALVEGRFAAAVELIGDARAATRAAPRWAKVQALYVRYQELDDYLAHGLIPDVQRVRTEISDLYSQDPETAKVAVPVLARDLEARLRGARDRQIAERLGQVGNEIFASGPPFGAIERE